MIPRAALALLALLGLAPPADEWLRWSAKECRKALEVRKERRVLVVLGIGLSSFGAASFSAVMLDDAGLKAAARLAGHQRRLDDSELLELLGQAGSPVEAVLFFVATDVPSRSPLSEKREFSVDPEATFLQHPKDRSKFLRAEIVALEPLERALLKWLRHEQGTLLRFPRSDPAVLSAKKVQLEVGLAEAEKPVRMKFKVR